MSMNVKNIEPGTKVNIELNHDGKDYCVESTVLTQYSAGVLITPVVCDGKMIQYCSDARMTFTDSYGKVRTFCLSSISPIDFSGSLFHVAQGCETVKVNNSRKAERYKIQRVATAYVAKKPVMKVLVNDLSMRGVSMIVGKNSNAFNIGDEIMLDMLKEDSYSHVKLTCQVVRKFKVDEFDAVGCVLKNVTTCLLDYILCIKKQKQEEKEARMFYNAV
ncbi:PilZ domain-containing protein [Butyrivibrio sp. CB08]|uniref:PilZ domain-containing protein n=1 Tax=Butyrivibrio sp. CB08 TaxID=2364879 RepID=UPI000EA969E5|nr:PilZ domain-containing protein [Butyrivibrio sp. CB08]RKM60429.1 PilZ domain-containing protein [Butyrivibrio sp. CB08]